MAWENDTCTLFVTNNFTWLQRVSMDIYTLQYLRVGDSDNKVKMSNSRNNTKETSST